jgi:hypothetical protein
VRVAAGVVVYTGWPAGRGGAGEVRTVEGGVAVGQGQDGKSR